MQQLISVAAYKKVTVFLRRTSKQSQCA